MSRWLPQCKFRRHKRLSRFRRPISTVVPQHKEQIARACDAAFPAWRGRRPERLAVFTSARKTAAVQRRHEKRASRRAALLNDIESCGFSHARSAAHFPSLFEIVYAGATSLARHDTVLPTTSGVMEFVFERASNGTLTVNDRSPIHADEVALGDSIKWRAPPMSAMIGEP